MIIVDSSVWIDHFNGVDAPHARRLLELIETDAHLGVVDLMFAEVLQGFRTELDATMADAALSVFDTVTTNGLEDARVAASLYRTARQKGVTVRSTIDALIAAVCIREGAALLHNDRDFTQLATVSDLEVL